MRSVPHCLVVRKAEGVPLRRQISLQLEGLIVGGEIAGGRRLPSIRAMAAGLDVHRNTVAAAYRDLRNRGLVRAVVGSGAWVAAETELSAGTSPEASALRQILVGCRSSGACPKRSAERLARWLEALEARRLAVRAPELTLGKTVCRELRARLPHVETRLLEPGAATVGASECWMPVDVTLPGGEPLGEPEAPAAFRLRVSIPGTVGRLARELPWGSVMGFASRSEAVRRMARGAVEIACGDRVGVGAGAPDDIEAIRRLDRIADAWFADADAIGHLHERIRCRCRRLDLIPIPSLRELGRLLADARAERERTVSAGVGEP